MFVCVYVCVYMIRLVYCEFVRMFVVNQPSDYDVLNLVSQQQQRNHTTKQGRNNAPIYLTEAEPASPVLHVTATSQICVPCGAFVRTLYVFVRLLGEFGLVTAL